MKTTIDMAREAGFETKRDMVFVDATEITPTLKAFEALVRADAHRTPLTNDEIAAIVRKAAKGAAIRRDGSTSERIARAIEAAHNIKENT